MRKKQSRRKQTYEAKPFFESVFHGMVEKSSLPCHDQTVKSVDQTPGKDNVSPEVQSPTAKR
jgi:hypothetical protein